MFLESDKINKHILDRFLRGIGETNIESLQMLKNFATDEQIQESFNCCFNEQRFSNFDIDKEHSQKTELNYLGGAVKLNIYTS